MANENQKKIKITNPEIAYRKAESYCAYQERCQQEVRNKLYEWGLWTDAVEEIITQLITNNFLNEERFAKAYAGGKFRIKKWGRVKIKMEFKKRNISEYCIKQAFKEIDEDDYIETLTTLYEKKYNALKGRKEIRTQTAAQYVISRGFESNMVWEIAKKHNNDKYHTKP